MQTIIPTANIRVTLWFTSVISGQAKVKVG